MSQSLVVGEQTAEGRKDFKYDALEPGCIRLVLIEPAPTKDPNVPLSCYLIHTPLPYNAEPAASYEALSYTWGSELATEPISIDGRTFHVRPNLHSAMRTLRKPDANLFLWIDAICINQDDVRERNSQVARMGTIYSFAARVLIHLGGGASDDFCARGLAHVRDTIEFIDKMDAWMNAQVDVVVRVGSRREERAARAEMLAQRYQFMFSREDPFEFVVSVSLALTQPWWKRVWTMQEVVLAEEPVLFCGDQILPWNSIRDFGRHLSMGPVRDVLYAQSERFPEAFVTSSRRMIEKLIIIHTVPINEIQALREATETNGQTVSLSSAVSALNGRQATDPRDMVYGVLGMADNHTDPILPDYTNGTTRSIYVAAFQRIIKEHGDLRCLVWAQMEGPSSRDSSLPSWVPGLAALFSSTGKRRTIGVGPTSLNRGLCGNPTLTRVFNAPGKTHRTLDTSFGGSDGSILVTKGVSFDKVVAISQRASRSENRDVQGENDSLEAVLQEWQETSSRLAEPYPTGVPLNKAFWMTVALGQKIIGYHPGFNRIDCQSPADYRLTDMDEKIPPRTPEDEAALIRALQEHNIGLRYFVTQDHYIGVGTLEVAIGDEVCVLMDAEVPFVLRRSQHRTHQLVGECYVHGIMDGEAIGIPDRASGRSRAARNAPAGIVTFEIV